MAVSSGSKSSLLRDSTCSWNAVSSAADPLGPYYRYEFRRKLFPIRPREVLAEIKQDPELKLIPVVVLTTSADEDDLRHSYDAGANSFVTKPADLQQFMNVVKAIEDFWFGISTLPASVAAKMSERG